MSIIAARRTGPSDARPHTGRATVALATIVAAIVVGVLSLFASSAASAAPLLHAGNGVGVIAPGAGQRVGPHDDIPAGQGRQRAPNYDQLVVGSGVGAEAAATAPRAVIGGMEDLGPGAIGPGEETLASRLPGDTGDRLGNWLNNREVLQQAMKEGNPIRDASVDSQGNLRLEDTRRFITMERDYLRSGGWTYDPSTTLWMPPGS